MSAIQAEQGLVGVSAAGQRLGWSLEGRAIWAALAEHCGGEVLGEKLVEPDDPAALRAQLRTVAPTLCALTDRVRRAFDEDRACAVIIPEVGLVEFDDDHRRKGMYALAALLGDPLANHPDEVVTWDVRDRSDEDGVQVSHSTSSRSAGYHTDAGYLKTPPRFFLLYAMKAAACGGGESLIRDGRTVLRQLSEFDEGRSAIGVLSQTLPRRVPAKLRPVAYLAEDGLQYSPVFADVPLWRWARRNSRLGLEANPDYATPEVWQALATVNEQLQNGPGELRPMVPTDGAIIVNNHIALHGRTKYTDRSRHLLRIRFHDSTPHTSPQTRLGSGTVSRPCG